MFSNPFGIFGHETCNAKVKDQVLTGICYNEVECLARSGTLSGYCQPPVVKGACCAFAYTDCDTRVRERTAYFVNKSYPKFDSDPFQCLLKIKPQRDACWV